MKHNKLMKTLSVFMSVVMIISCGIVAAFAVDPEDCDHSLYTYTWKTVKEPDCKAEENGLEQKVCDNCGAVLDDHVLDWEYAHDYSKTKMLKEPTCTEKGEYKEYCVYCDKPASYTVLIPNTHDGFRNEFENGKMEVWSYTGYADWYTDSPASCTQPGLHHAICKECGETIASEPIEPLGHKSEVYEDWLGSINDAEYYIGSKNVAYKAPTCTEAGSITFNCDVCGEPVRVFELEAEGHHNSALEAWDYCFATDPDFGTDEDLIQYADWNDVDYIPATCTQPGLVTFKCNTCQEVMRTMTLMPLGHHSDALDDYNAGIGDLEDYIGEQNVDVNMPTCTDEGSVTFKCDRCGEAVASFTLEAKGHYSLALEDYLTSTYDLEDYIGYRNVETIMPTCTHVGKITFKCDECGKEIRSYGLKPTGHDSGVWRIDFEATPDHDGQMTKYCSICGEALESKPVSLHKHSFGYEAVTIKPTCTQDGEKGIYCADCGVVYDTEVIPAIGHNFGDWYKNNDGTHSRGCDRCGYKETANCNYAEIVTKPTCTDGGYTTYICSDCGHTYIDDYTDALGHDWGEWIDDDNGETHTRTCARCAETETADHDFSDWKYNNDGTFFRNGTKSRVCADCGRIETEEAHHTSLVCRIFYPVLLWFAEIGRKFGYVVSLKWFLPQLNLEPKM